MSDSQACAWTVCSPTSVLALVEVVLIHDLKLGRSWRGHGPGFDNHWRRRDFDDAGGRLAACEGGHCQQSQHHSEV